MIVRWSPLAIDRVVEIGEWVASERPAAAGRIVDGLFNAAERLETFPLSGRRVPEFDERTDLREVIFEQFRIVYKVSDLHIDILTVRHTLQLMGSSAAEDELSNARQQESSLLRSVSPSNALGASTRSYTVCGRSQPTLHCVLHDTSAPSDRFWLNLQARYDLDVERDRPGDRLKKEVAVLVRASYQADESVRRAVGAGRAG